MLKGFRDFLFRGNAIDLAVGVIIGAAFGAVVNSLAADIITPLIGWIFGTPDYSNLVLGPIKVGNLINAIISLLITAAALYFFIVAPINAMMERMKRQEQVEPPAPSVQEKLLMEIRDTLKEQRSPATRPAGSGE
jgi:large conductance mechanosensitive channel